MQSIKSRAAHEPEALNEAMDEDQLSANVHNLLAKIPEDAVMHPNTLMNIGLANFNNGEMEKAKGYLDRTIRDHPSVAQAYYFRGLTSLNLTENEDALADFKHYLEADPEGAHAAEVKEYVSYLESQGASQ